VREYRDEAGARSPTCDTRDRICRPVLLESDVRDRSSSRVRSLRPAERERSEDDENSSYGDDHAGYQEALARRPPPAAALYTPEPPAAIPRRRDLYHPLALVPRTRSRHVPRPPVRSRSSSLIRTGLRSPTHRASEDRDEAYQHERDPHEPGHVGNLHPARARGLRATVAPLGSLAASSLQAGESGRLALTDSVSERR
jgi:hypothetical protein